MGRRRRRRPGHRQRLGPVLARLGRAGGGQPGGERRAVRRARRSSTASRSSSRSASPAANAHLDTLPARRSTRCAPRGLGTSTSACVRSELGKPTCGRRRRRPTARAGVRRRRGPPHRVRCRRRRADRRADRAGAGHGRARPRRRRRDHRAGAGHRAVHGAADAARASRPPSPRTPASCWSAAAWRWSPGDSGQAIWASRRRRPGFEVRSPSRATPATVRSLVSHTFYERSHPTLEENPGGSPRPRRGDVHRDRAGRALRGRALDRARRTRCCWRARGARVSGRSRCSACASPALLGAGPRRGPTRRSATLRGRAAVRRRDRRRAAAGGHADLRARRRPRRRWSRTRRSPGTRPASLVDVVADTAELAKEAAYFGVHPALHRAVPGPQDDRRQRRRAVHAGGDPGLGGLHVLDLPPAAAGRSGRAVRPVSSRASPATADSEETADALV